MRHLLCYLVGAVAGRRCTKGKQQQQSPNWLSPAKAAGLPLRRISAACATSSAISSSELLELPPSPAADAGDRAAGPAASSSSEDIASDAASCAQWRLRKFVEVRVDRRELVVASHAQNEPGRALFKYMCRLRCGLVSPRP